MIADEAGSVLFEVFSTGEEVASIQLRHYRQTARECVNFFYAAPGAEITCKVNLTDENGWTNTLFSDTVVMPTRLWRMVTVVLDAGVHLISVSFESTAYSAVIVDDFWVAPCKDISE